MVEKLMLSAPKLCHILFIFYFFAKLLPPELQKLVNETTQTCFMQYMEKYNRYQQTVVKFFAPKYADYDGIQSKKKK